MNDSAPTCINKEKLEKLRSGDESFIPETFHTPPKALVFDPNDGAEYISSIIQCVPFNVSTLTNFPMNWKGLQRMDTRSIRRLACNKYDIINGQLEFYIYESIKTNFINFIETCIPFKCIQAISYVMSLNTDDLYELSLAFDNAYYEFKEYIVNLIHNWNAPYGCSIDTPWDVYGHEDDESAYDKSFDNRFAKSYELGNNLLQIYATIISKAVATYFDNTMLTIYCTSNGEYTKEIKKLIFEYFPEYEKAKDSSKILDSEIAQKMAISNAFYGCLNCFIMDKVINIMEYAMMSLSSTFYYVYEDYYRTETEEGKEMNKRQNNENM